MDIEGFTPPYICIAKGCAEEAVVEVERGNLELGTVTRDLRLCRAHAEAVAQPSTSITIER